MAPRRVVALLRGVNIGGKRMDMVRLRALLTGMGYDDVRTHLQSGNAVFGCTTRNLASVGSDIEKAVLSEFGFATRIVMRKHDDLTSAIASDPLLDLVDNPSRHLVGFLSDEPSRARAAELTAADYGTDRISIVGKHLYMWCPNGVSASPFFKIDFDRKLGVTVTNRNWTTVLKLAEMTA